METLVTFQKISSFCRYLDEVFGTSYKSLKLYNDLISKTTLSDYDDIEKHILLFSNFCINNNEAIMSNNNDASKLVEHKIIYSDKVFIDMGTLLVDSDKLVWDKLIELTKIFDPVFTSRHMLSTFGIGNGPESDLIVDIMVKFLNTKKDKKKIDRDFFSEMSGIMVERITCGKVSVEKLLDTILLFCKPGDIFHRLVAIQKTFTSVFGNKIFTSVFGKKPLPSVFGNHYHSLKS